jgi:hypothetical protein
MTEQRNYGVTIMVVDRYWGTEIYVEDGESPEAAQKLVQQQLDELPVVGVTGRFKITGVRKLP